MQNFIPFPVYTWFIFIATTSRIKNLVRIIVPIIISIFVNVLSFINGNNYTEAACLCLSQWINLKFSSYSMTFLKIRLENRDIIPGVLITWCFGLSSFFSIVLYAMLQKGLACLILNDFVLVNYTWLDYQLIVWVHYKKLKLYLKEQLLLWKDLHHSFSK